jgi:hypothetical protein
MRNSFPRASAAALGLLCAAATYAIAQDARPSPPPASANDFIRSLEDNLRSRASQDQPALGTATEDARKADETAARTVCAAEQLPVTPPDPAMLASCLAAKGIAKF